MIKECDSNFEFIESYFGLEDDDYLLIKRIEGKNNNGMITQGYYR